MKIEDAMIKNFKFILKSYFSIIIFLKNKSLKIIKPIFGLKL